MRSGTKLSQFLGIFPTFSLLTNVQKPITTKQIDENIAIRRKCTRFKTTIRT